jgi:hypothetical protein
VRRDGRDVLVRNGVEEERRVEQVQEAIMAAVSELVGLPFPLGRWAWIESDASANGPGWTGTLPGPWPIC